MILALFAVGRDRGAARWRWVILATALAAFLGGLALQKSKHAQFVTIAQNTPHMAAKFGPRRLTVEQQREMLAALLPFAGTVIGLSAPDNDGEIAQYAKDLATVLEGAHWRVERMTSTVETGESGLGLSFASRDGDRGGEALARALWQGGIPFARVNWQLGAPMTVELRVSARRE